MKFYTRVRVPRKTELSILSICFLFRLQSVRDSEEENRLQSVEEMRNEIAVLKRNVEVTVCQITCYIFIRPNFFQAKLTGLPFMFLFSVVERFGGRKPVAQRRNKYTKRICGNEFSLFKKLSLHTQIENLSFSLFSPTRCSDLRGRSMVATIDLINSIWFDFAQQNHYARYCLVCFCYLHEPLGERSFSRDPTRFVVISILTVKLSHLGAILLRLQHGSYGV